MGSIREERSHDEAESQRKGEVVLLVYNNYLKKWTQDHTENTLNPSEGSGSKSLMSSLLAPLNIAMLVTKHLI